VANSAFQYPIGDGANIHDVHQLLTASGGENTLNVGNTPITRFGTYQDVIVTVNGTVTTLSYVGLTGTFPSALTPSAAVIVDFNTSDATYIPSTLSTVGGTFESAMLGYGATSYYSLKEGSGNFVDQGTLGVNMVPATPPSGSSVNRGLVPFITSLYLQNCVGTYNWAVGTVSAQVIPFGTTSDISIVIPIEDFVLPGSGSLSYFFGQGDRGVSGSQGVSCYVDHAGNVTMENFFTSTYQTLSSTSAPLSNPTGKNLLVVTYNHTSTTLTIYVNGTQVAQNASWIYGMSNSTNSGTPFIVGGLWTSGSVQTGKSFPAAHWQGVGVLKNIVLSSAQITNLYSLMTATTGNRIYATWNPFDKSPNEALSNANLTASDTSNANWYIVRANESATQHDFYIEGTVNVIGSGNSGCIGLCLPNAIISSTNYLGSFGDSLGFFLTRGGNPQKADTGGTFTNLSFSNFIVGDRFMLAVQRTTGKMWIGKNGTWNGTGNPSTGANPDLTFSLDEWAAAAANIDLSALTINTGQSAFSYTVPTGFAAGLFRDL
jgi:hypothetical protein